MRNTKNQAFTLVELIVVITILAILGTIAFISLQGYSQDAKNSKVSSDVATLVQKISIRTTDVKNSVTLDQLVKSEDTTKEFTTGTAGSGAIDLATDSYKVWTIDFVRLQESKDDFVDNDGNDYIYAYAAKGKSIMYQVAGKIKDAAGVETAVVKWNFYFNPDVTTDVAGLINGTNGAVIANSGISLPY